MGKPQYGKSLAQGHQHIGGQGTNYIPQLAAYNSADAAREHEHQQYTGGKFDASVVIGEHGYQVYYGHRHADATEHDCAADPHNHFLFRQRKVPDLPLRRLSRLFSSRRFTNQ